MSLLANLLSKIKHQQSKREIPPNLKHIVSDSAHRSAHKRKIILIAVFFIVAVGAGIFAIHFINSLTAALSASQVSKIGSQESKVRRQEQEAGIQTTVAENQESEIRNQRELSGTVKPEKSDEGTKTDNAISKETLVETFISQQDTKYGKNNPPSSPFSKGGIGGFSSEKKEIEIENMIEDKNTAQRDAYLYSARNYEIKKDYSKALSDYKKALEIDKDNFTVMNNISYMLLHLGLTNESMEYSQMALNIKKDYVPALINLAVAHAKAGDISTAETYLNSALMKEPDNQSVLLNCAVFYEKKGDYHMASEYFLKLSRWGNIIGSLGLARVYEKQDKKKEAFKIYKDIYSLGTIDNETRHMVRERIILLSGS